MEILKGGEVELVILEIYWEKDRFTEKGGTNGMGRTNQRNFLRAFPIPSSCLK